MKKFYLGCDVSKGYADFIILSEKSCVIEEPFQLDDTFEGHNILTNILSNFFKKHTGASLYVGLESTGGYEDNWYKLFLNLTNLNALKITRLNPLPVKRHGSALMNRNVTDKISASTIASYLISYEDNITYNEDDSLKRVRKQWEYIQLLLKQQTQLRNNLETFLYQSNPELLQYCKDTLPQWVIAVLEKYPTAQKLSRAHLKTLLKIPHINESRAEKLINAAKQSVAAHNTEIDEYMICKLITRLKNLDLEINEQKDVLTKKSNFTSAELDILTSFPGIGRYSAVGLLINIVNVSRFSNVKKLTSFFGLHPVIRDSGDGSMKPHLSKRGRSGPRSILFMVAMTATQCNPVIKKVYEKHLSRGMCKKAALGVCMHKILRMIYGMLKNKTHFNPEIDVIHQRKENIKSKKGNYARRFQSQDETAPISQRQSKKRKKGEDNKVPQNNNIIYNEVTSSLLRYKDNKKQTNKFNKNQPEKIGMVLEKIMT